MYNVLKLWPSFKHFNSTRQMASPVVVCTLLIVGGIWQLQWIAERWEHWWRISTVITWNWNWLSIWYTMYKCQNL